MKLPATESLFEHASCGLILMDESGVVRRVNATFCEWIGKSANELVGKVRLQDLFTAGGRLFYQTHWSPLMEMQGQLAEVKMDVLHQSGHAIPMLFNAIRRMHEDTKFDEVSVFVATSRNSYENELRGARNTAEAALEERRQAQQLLTDTNQQLFDADIEKNAFIATLAHELRNPLSPIANAASMIQLTSDDSKVLRFAGIIDRQIKHLARLVSDLLDVSRISTGQIHLIKQVTRLDAVMEVALDIATPMFAKREQVFEIVCDRRDIPLFCDPSRISQVLGNVLVNASKYTNKHGAIILVVEMYGRNLVFRVQDNGIGISQAQMQKIFSLFNQVDARAERSEGGMGIGLALVKKLAELHGGNVDVSSQLGVGSTFTITLPIIQA